MCRVWYATKERSGSCVNYLYNAEATAIAHRQNIDAHSYSDDTQLHINRKVKEMESSTSHLVTCINEINCWMSAIDTTLREVAQLY